MVQMLSGFRPVVQFRANNKNNDEINYQKIDARLAMAIENGKTPISLFIKTTGGELTANQVKELADLGLTAYPIAGNIATGRLNDLSNLAKITQLSYISHLSGSQQLRPNFQ